MPTDDLALTPYVPPRWDTPTREALDEWTFGSLTPIPPLMWAQYPGADQVVDLVVDADQAAESTSGATEEERTVCNPDARVQGMVVAETDWGTDEHGAVVAGLVISQTCDVVATGPGERHATVQVAPVVRVDTGIDGIDENRLAAIGRWEVADRALLDPPGWTGTYIADLRLSVPVSKGVLARHRPVPAFDDERRMLLLAQHVATKVRRPALHDFLAETVRDEIRQSIKAAKRDASWWAPVEEVLVTATPDRLAPTHAQLLVVSQVPLDPEAKQRWHDLNERLVGRGRKVGIVLRSPLHATANKLTADMYRTAVKLHVPELRSPVY